MKHVARALVCALALGAVVTAADASPVTAADSRAVVVIDTGQGSRRTVIAFSGTISGIRALELAGANPVTYGFAGQGAAVCALDGVGHPATDGCLGTPSDPRYWAYFRAPDGAGGWSYSNECACTTTVDDGDVEGWRFGTGQQPPFVTFCAAAGCGPPPTPPPTPDAAPAPGGGGGGTAGGGSAASAGGGTATPGAAAEPNAGVGGPNPSDDPGTAANAATAASAATSPSSSPTSVARRADGEVRSAADLPRVRDDGGSGSPWGVIVAVVVVGALGGLAVVVRRRRSTA